MEQLLKILEDNARLSVEDIATMLNKSPAEVAAMIDLARAHFTQRSANRLPANGLFSLHRRMPRYSTRVNAFVLLQVLL